MTGRNQSAAEPRTSGELQYRPQRLYLMRRRALAMARPIFDQSVASLLGHNERDRLWAAVQACIRDVTTHHIDNSPPNTLFNYATMVPRAVATVLSDNRDMLQFDMGDGKHVDKSLPDELM